MVYTKTYNRVKSFLSSRKNTYSTVNDIVYNTHLSMISVRRVISEMKQETLLDTKPLEMKGFGYKLKR
jgi:hypothetical protein